MNISYKKAIIAALPVLGLASCMDFDSPSDEFTGGTVVVEPVVFHGKADSIDFRTMYPIDSLYKGLDDLGSAIGQLKTAQYYARGSKNGQVSDQNCYQYVYSLSTDVYAGFFTNAQSWNGQLNSSYSYTYGFMDGPYGAFTGVKDNVINMLNGKAIDFVPELKAMGLLIFNYSAAEMVDIYGTIPYSDHKNNKQINPFTFDKGQDIYTTIIDNLDTINACFKHYATKPDWYKEVVDMVVMDADGITLDKTIDSWRRFANSLKLRMAMHYVKVDANQAKKWAEEAVAEGVVENYDQEIVLNQRNMLGGNPMFGISNQWGDSRLNAQFETLLASLGHPFLNYWFNENTNDIVNTYDQTKVMKAGTKVVGIRPGLLMPTGQGIGNNVMFAYSNVRGDGEINGKHYYSHCNYAPLYFIKVSEMEFLRAEGALRGWDMGGDAQTWYEKGIRDGEIADRYNSIIDVHWKDFVDDYMKLEKAIPYVYEDPMDEENNEMTPTTIGVKWNSADSREVMLEKIITQKYISLFPYSYEAWTELRRTGYPKLLPVLNVSEYSDGSLMDGDLIRRIPLPGRKTSVGLVDINTSGIEALGGADQQGTRVFWDVNTGNF